MMDFLINFSYIVLIIGVMILSGVNLLDAIKDWFKSKRFNETILIISTLLFITSLFAGYDFFFTESKFTKQAIIMELNKEYKLVPKELDSQNQKNILSFIKETFPDIFQKLNELKNKEPILLNTIQDLVTLKGNFPEKEYEIQLKINKWKQLKSDIGATIIKLERDMKEIYVSTQLNSFDKENSVAFKNIQENLLEKADELLISTKVLLEETK